MPNICASSVQYREARRQALASLASSSDQLMTDVHMDIQEDIQEEEIQDMLYDFFCDDLPHKQDVNVNKENREKM